MLQCCSLFNCSSIRYIADDDIRDEPDEDEGFRLLFFTEIELNIQPKVVNREQLLWYFSRFVGEFLVQLPCKTSELLVL